MNGMEPFSEGHGGGMKEGASFLLFLPEDLFFIYTKVPLLPSFLSWCFFLSRSLPPSLSPPPFPLLFCLSLHPLLLPSKAPNSFELLHGGGEKKKKRKKRTNKSEGMKGDRKTRKGKRTV